MFSWDPKIYREIRLSVIKGSEDVSQGITRVTRYLLYCHNKTRPQGSSVSSFLLDRLHLCVPKWVFRDLCRLDLFTKFYRGKKKNFCQKCQTLHTTPTVPKCLHSGPVGSELIRKEQESFPNG